MKDIFVEAGGHRADYAVEVHKLHVKTGELTVERELLVKSASPEPTGAPGDGQARPPKAEFEPSIRIAVDQPPPSSARSNARPCVCTHLP